MPKQLAFTISSQLKTIIGRELITDDFIAIFELVKNSYDANAKKVEIIFKQVKHKRDIREAKIFVVDDGDGMSYDDLETKWLLVGYSEKRDLEEKLESKDFRDKIAQRRIFAGAKGIGRFSCDKLGSRLELYTKKENEGIIHVLHMDWDKFEEDPKKEFRKIGVEYEAVKRLDIDARVDNFNKGTILEISSLRDGWDRKKLLKLKSHLQRLVNPAQVGETQGFAIYLKAEEFFEDDKKYGHKGNHEIINGIIRNVLFEDLGIKTTTINCIVAGNKISTELIDKGEFIYRVKEENVCQPLDNINIKLFYLNKSAKIAFHKRMGIHPVRYGSVFFYKNGIKINPYGNEGDDWLGLDRRKTQGTRRFLGNRDLMGRIEVSGYQPYFREVSSRDGGVVKTREFELLEGLFKEKALRRLEKYVIEGINWDSESRPKTPEEIKSDSFEIVSQLIGEVKDKGEKIEFNERLLDIYADKQIEKTPELIKNIETVKNLVESKEDRAYVDLQIKAVKSAFKNLQQKQKELGKEIELRERQSLFLEHVAGEDKKEILALQHQIGLSALLVKKHLKILRDKIISGEQISNKDLLEAIDNILLQTQIMSLIARAPFVAKAKFELTEEEIDGDLALYIKQYIERVYVPFNEKELEEKRVTIRVDCAPNIEFKRVFEPFKFMVVIDNLIDNSMKANATHIDVKIDVSNGNAMELRIKDDGVGIRDEDLGRIFSFGFSTTGGSGIGLYHVKKIVEEYGSITVNNHLNKGVEFIIKVMK
jgi:signal transduction histidine kinase